MISLILIGVLVLMLAVAVSSAMRHAARARALEEEFKSKLQRSERTLQDLRSASARANVELSGLSSILLLLPDLARQVSSCPTSKDLEETIVRMTQQMLDAREVSYFSAEGDVLVLKASAGLSQNQQRAVHPIPIGQGPIGWAAQKQMIMSEEDFQRESNLARQALDLKAPVASDLCAPLVHGQRLYGVINVGGVARREHARRIMTMITNLSVIAVENLALLQEAHRTANLDSLTRLYNLGYCSQQCEQEVRKAHRYNRSVTVVLFDMDQLNSYNRAFGQMEGDSVLRVVANLIKESVRTVDIVCRYGGQQFAVVLPETGKNEALRVAERARKRVEEHPFALRKITMSGGIAAYPQDGRDVVGLFKAAETALSAAKNNGRNRIETLSEGAGPIS
jgi:diguanylate cyclase (GGDEF)-like protein